MLKDTNYTSKCMDVIYNIVCKNCPYRAIQEKQLDPFMSSSEISGETGNITQGGVYTSNKKKESTDTDYKSVLAAEHAATVNHVIDWDNVKVIEEDHN